MCKRNILMKLFPVNCIVLAAVILISVYGSQTVITINRNLPVSERKTVIIDAGHGDPDGGATSCTGALESDINLDISQRLNDLCRFLGLHTIMTRTSEQSVYTDGNTIAQKKLSDLKNRVKLVNETEDAILISIHQNHFFEDQYSGAQVFYSNRDESQLLAKQLQSELIRCVNPQSNRKAKKSTGVYLMEHINCPGVLVECGFLSNREEEANLRSAEYQKKLCCVIASVCSNFLRSDMTS